MGSAGIGAFFNKSNSKSKETIKRDPQSEAIAKQLLEEISSSRAFTGGLGPLLNNILGASSLDPRTSNLLNYASDFAQEPGLSLDDYYNRTLESLNPDFYLDNANKYLNRVLGPQIQGDYSLLGLGRSGAGLEARARAGSELSLPISQQYLSNLYDLNRSLPTTDIALRGARLGRLGDALEFSDYPRQASLDASQRALQGLLSAYTQTPYTAAPTTKVKGSNLQYGASAEAKVPIG